MRTGGCFNFFSLNALSVLAAFRFRFGRSGVVRSDGVGAVEVEGYSNKSVAMSIGRVETDSACVSVMVIGLEGSVKKGALIQGGTYSREDILMGDLGGFYFNLLIKLFFNQLMN